MIFASFIYPPFATNKAPGPIQTHKKMPSMQTYFSPHQAAHAPLRELNNGEWVDFAETPARLD